MQFGHSWWFFSVLAGALLGLSLLLPWLWPLVLLGGVLSLRTFRLVSPGRAALAAFLAGTVKSLLAMGFVWSVYPLDWINATKPIVQIIAVATVWIPAALALGSGWLFFGYVYRRWLIQVDGWWRLAGVGLLWMGADVIGMLIFSLWSLGPDSTLQPYFSFGQTGYALVPHNLLFMIGALGGVYGLSFLVGVLVEGFRSSLPLERRGNYFLVAVFLLMTTAFIPLSAFKSKPLSQTEPAIKVALVETTWPRLGTPEDISIADKKEILSAIITATASSGAQVLILPEDSRLTEVYGGAESTMERIKKLFPHGQVIDSARTDLADAAVMRVYIYDTEHAKLYLFDKQYLVPYGEYLPFIHRELYEKFFASGGSLGTALADMNYVPGLKQTDMFLPSYIPSVLFCSESVHPLGVLLGLGQRKDTLFVAHIVSHAWFHGSPPELQYQLDTMLKIQARFNNKPILQSANQGEVKVFTAAGKIEIPVTAAEGEGWKLYLYSL